MEDLSSDSKKARALQRWKILGNVLKGRKSAEGDLLSASVRSFGTFGLFNCVSERQTEEGHRWISYSWKCNSAVSQLSVRHLREEISATDLIGFNNTGNVCMWPAEELLAHYLLTKAASFQGQCVCELGAGMTALAGIMLASATNLRSILLTDGNKKSVENIECILSENKAKLQGDIEPARVLIWDRQSAYLDLAGRFDSIICADCLFFTDFHEDLLHVIHTLLKPSGKAFIIAPQRGSTLAMFCSRASRLFSVTEVEKYDETVWQKHILAKESASSYNEDLHYPRLLLLENK